MAQLESLSPIDFEDLCRDLAKAELGIRFSAFGPGADGGIDGRHARDAESVILQCKHYSGSTFSQLKFALKKELSKIEKINPKRYLLFTSQSLTPSRSDELADILGEILIAAGDIWSKEDILAALKRHPAIEKSHIKLWLSSTAVLERILHSGLESFTSATKEEILGELKVYVRNSSFDIAIERLEKEKILIITGPPGVGKTTLAKMISYQYLDDGWRFSAIRSLSEGFAVVQDEIPTVYYFDDFLGRVELDRQAMLQNDSALATFANRIKRSKNARFILTSRAHIFEEARLSSDYIDDPGLQLAKYILDVGAYTRKIRSLILFNHLAASSLTADHFACLLEGDWLKTIVDHRSYNPRVIASVSSNSLEYVGPRDYPKTICDALDNPDLIWSKPFRNIDIKSQNLLTALFFGNQYQIIISELRSMFGGVHRAICAFHSQPTKPTDFEEALRSLESGFIAISGQTVQYVNPSLRDFMRSYLIDKEMLMLLPRASARADWARQLWLHFKSIYKAHPSAVKDFANKFSYFVQCDGVVDARTISEHVDADGLSRCTWVEFLLDLWESTENDDFVLAASSVLDDDSLDWDAIYDGDELPELHSRIRHSMSTDHPLRATLLSLTDRRLSKILGCSFPLEALVAIVGSVYEFMSEDLSNGAARQLDELVRYEFRQTSDSVSHLSTREELTDHLEHLRSLAAVTGDSIDAAEDIISEKIDETDEDEPEEKETSFSRRNSNSTDQFNDKELRSLFSSLVS